MPMTQGGQRGGRKQGITSGMKALLTSGALTMVLWLWVMLATLERSSEETAEAAPEPLSVPPATMRLEPLPTLMPAPDLSREILMASSAARTQRSSSSLQLIQAPAPSRSKPAAVTRSSR